MYGVRKKDFTYLTNLQQILDFLIQKDHGYYKLTLFLIKQD